MSYDNLVHKAWLQQREKTSSCASCSVWGLLSHCGASGISAAIIHLLFKSAKTGHSHSFLDQVNKYLTYPELYSNVTLHRHQSFPEALPCLYEAACVSWASDRMICLSHLISFLFPLNGQCIVEAAVNTEKRVLLECSAKHCTSVI